LPRFGSMDWTASSKLSWSLGRGRLWLAGALALAVVAGAEGQRAVVSVPILSGTLSFDGRATLGDFTGTTTTVSGQMVGGAALSEARGWVEAPVATLKTGNGRRDRDLNKSMESETYPTIRFDLQRVRTEWERGDSAAVEVSGTFTIHGVAREQTFGATVLFEREAVRLKASLPMNLKDYQVKGLSKFLGTIKMHPDIVVHVDVVFGHESPARPTGPR